MPQSFALTKWYMDLVADDGEAIIAYAADVSFSGMSLHYASILQHRGGQTRSTSSLRKASPALEGGTLTWTSRALRVRGSWHSECEGTRETLLLNESGAVDWNCVMPLARAEIELHDGRTVRGLGYAEELKMTIAPWELPIDELRWGRFTAEGTSVVWLDWRGSHSKKIILRNGARASGMVEERSIELVDDDVRVVMEGGHVLREGSLGSSALAAIADLVPILPAKLVATTERKMLAHATLEQPFAATVKGSAIAEVVKWG